jgi:acyl-lipid omega-6 desaturase (Delta-12 desaturase)
MAGAGEPAPPSGYSPSEFPSWRSLLTPYERPVLRHSLGQIASSFLPYFALWALMAAASTVSPWLALALVPLAAGFLVRIFIIGHDCGHGSFFASRTANDALGFIAGVLTFTPYHYWRHHHAIHHATSGNLDRRGVGDIWTLTLNEYRALSPPRRLAYRIQRNPFVLFGFGPIYLFFFRHRYAARHDELRWHRSVLWSNLGLLAVAVGMSALLGWKTYLLIQLPVMFLGGMVGIWLFYIQHQFEGAYWQSGERWNYLTSALRGGSYYRLPRLLQWFSGNIGFHHIHHLSPRIPNYELEPCHRENPRFHDVPTLTLRSSLRSIGLRVWDEEQGRMVGMGPFWL